ncbi:D-isomer specific 2-hydroxyacid dehydrogenase family protein [Streptomyces xanthochromogenes]|nr:D-isomer specific 2-hydroxyacid dehydrogenase family protein [Streptomyces xanthochromogenes]
MVTHETILWQADQELCSTARAVLTDDGYAVLEAEHSQDVRHPDQIIGIIADHREQWDRERLTRFPQVRALVRLGVGIDNVKVDEIEGAGIRFDSVPAYGTTDVADHAMAMILDLSRQLTARSERLRKGGTRAWRADLENGFRLRGRTLAVVGLGRIGLSVARRAAAFGIEVMFFDPFLPEGTELAHGWPRLQSVREVATADICTLHCPATPLTQHMIDRHYWDDVAASGPPDGQILINTARGSLVDWQAFNHAFDKGVARAAGFDVLEQEPFQEDDPLISQWCKEDPTVHGRLLLTPHVAFASPEAVRDLHEGAAARLVRALSETHGSRRGIQHLEHLT